MKTPEGQQQTQRPRLAAAGIAVGIVLAVALFAAIYALRQTAQPEEPPGVALLEGDTGPAPDVSYLWTAGIVLSLRQQERLRELEGRQQKELGPLLQRLEKAADALDAALNRRTDAPDENKEARPADNEAASLKELSAKVNKVREKYWEEALSLLTEEQRATVEAKRRQEWAEMLKRLGIPAAPAGNPNAPSRP
ncbi:MAG: hypothetical protein KatS3mg024_0993 [Armatimonadota bacterium]|nr:MAG: hypothetical protein KatS3mg024_0993 [Armatimonadota bacterium]